MSALTDGSFTEREYNEDIFETVIARYFNERRTSAFLPPVFAINKDRAGAGAKQEAAIWAAKAMATHNYVSHTDYLGRTFSTRLHIADPSNQWAGEIIAFGYYTPQAVGDAWMNSDGHRAVILGGQYKFAGIAKVENDQGWPYYDCVFGSEPYARTPAPKTVAAAGAPAPKLAGLHRPDPASGPWLYLPEPVTIGPR